MPELLTAADELFTYQTNRCVLFPERSIFDYCLIYLKEGMAEVTCNKHTYLCRTGDVILLRPKTKHTITVVGNIFHQPHIHFSVTPYKDAIKTYIPFEPIEKIPAEHHYMFCDDTIDEYMQIHFPVRFTPSNPETVEALIMNIIHEFMLRDTFLKDMGTSAAISQLLVHLARDLHNIHSSNQSPLNLKLNEIKKYIELHFAEDITLEQLEHDFYISRYYLVTKFTEHFGITPIKYRNQLRMERAKILLHNPANRICDIADMLSFGSAQVFSRAFRTAVGVSPESYRDNIDYL